MWAIVVIASLALLFTLLLCIPLNLVFQTSIYGNLKTNFRLVWLFGLVNTELRQTARKHKEKSAVEHEQKRVDWTQGIMATSEVLRTKGFVGRLFTLIKRSIRRINIKELVADFKLGLENPADLGLLFAFLAPLNLLLSYLSPHHIRIEPSFTSDAIIEGELYGEIRLLPIRLAAPVLGFAFSLPTMQVAKKLVLSKWKRRK